MSGAVMGALLDMLRADEGVRAHFGEPARVFDDETARAAYPFARVERHEVRDAGASGVSAAEHRITLGLEVREGGLFGARQALHALRDAVEGGVLSVPGHHVVLMQSVFADVMRRNDQRAFRGVLRVRIVVDREAS